MAAEKRARKHSSEIEDIRARLAEAEETLRAIREGEVDAVIVSGTKGEQVFSLTGTDSIYRLIVETMKEAAFTVTFDGKILYCNAQFGDFLKRPMEQIVGHSLQQFVDPANRSAAAALLAVTQEQLVKQRLVLRNSQDQCVPVHVAANVLNQPDGLSICIVATDLTELENSTEMIHRLRRQQEALQAANEELAATEEELRVQNEELAASREELDRARERYQNLFETAPDGYISTDADGTIQETNRAAAALFGSDAEKLRGNPFSALLPISERDNYHRIMARIIAGEKPLPKWELELRPSECAPFWAAVSAAASRDEEGRIIGLRWLIREVTERKEAEKAVRESEFRYRTVADNTFAFEFWINPEGRFLYASPACEQLYGRAPDEFLADPDLLSNAVHPEDRAAFDRHVSEERGRASGVAEFRIIKNDGIQCWIGHACRPVFDELGHYLGIRGSNRDITNRKQGEHALQQMNARLELKVQERTAELTQRAAQLRGLFGELTLSEQRERRRLARVLHDHLQQVLVAAKFRSTSVARRIDPMMKQAVHEVESLIDEAIEASRSLTVELSPPVLHEGGLMPGVEWLVRRMREKHGLVVDLSLEGALPPLAEDIKTLLFESIRELLFNTVKHARGPANVHFHQVDGRELRIVVSDPGPGFDPASLEKEGGGFGLCSIRERLDIIGGKMIIESAPGNSSRFTLIAPVNQISEAKSPVNL